MQAIYKITNKVNGKFYIGSTNNVRKRWNNHRCNLRNNRHENSYLQQAWNKYGEEAFEFSILEEVNDKNRIKREIYYLKETKCYERNIGYNFDKNPTDKSGKNNSFYGKKHTEEVKDRMREIALNRPQEYKDKLLQSVKRGEEHRDAILTWDKVREIRSKYIPKLYGYRKLGEEYGVAKTTIQAIIENRSWRE